MYDVDLAFRNNRCLNLLSTYLNLFVKVRVTLKNILGMLVFILAIANNIKISIAKASFLIFFWIFICKISPFIMGIILALSDVFTLFICLFSSNKIEFNCWYRLLNLVATFFFTIVYKKLFVLATLGLIYWLKSIFFPLFFLLTL